MAPRTSAPRLDAVSANAVDLARAALEAVTEPGQVGAHERVIASGDRLVTHVFACTMPGYRGWSWVVVLARAPRAKVPTVSETALLPGEDSVLAPAWEPWSERLRPTDVGPDDLLPYLDTDPRLEQGYEQTDDEEADRATPWELGLGRKRVLSPLGRGEAADRWQEGEFGTRTDGERRRKAPADDTAGQDCGSCGFLTLLAGSLRHEFGVCTNEWSPADGRVVALDYRCGAHSETGHEDTPPEDPSHGVVLDELGIDYVDQPAAEASATEAAETPEELEPAEA
ncbi:DUF3027 domain-containing protein [Brachybacterium sp. AOP25-B2-12]|uniref:DUF3027 domain-containing protein n=1 Tax=Brachybacterium sp. AOP25-B2-12 TaxID=3457710 RepID=UPI0040339082